MYVRRKKIASNSKIKSYLKLPNMAACGKNAFTLSVLTQLKRPNQLLNAYSNRELKDMQNKIDMQCASWNSN